MVGAALIDLHLVLQPLSFMLGHPTLLVKHLQYPHTQWYITYTAAHPPLTEYIVVSLIVYNSSVSTKELHPLGYKLPK